MQGNKIFYIRHLLQTILWQMKFNILIQLRIAKATYLYIYQYAITLKKIIKL